MTPSRSRMLIMAGILGLVAVLGIAWLIGAATGHEGGSQAGSRTQAPGGLVGLPDENPTGETPDPGSTTGDTPGPGSTDGDPAGSPSNRPDSSAPTSRNNRRSVHWNGVRLDGDNNGDGCVTIINKTATVGVIESVSFTVVSGPGRATARPDTGHCDTDGNPLCQGVRLRPDTRCVAGAVLTGDASNQAYTVRATVHVRYLCSNKVDSPCDEVLNWGGPPPTPESPVEFWGATSTKVPLTEAFVGGSPSPDEEGSPEPPSESADPSDETPDTPTDTPDTSDEGSSSPDEGSGTSDEGSGSSDASPDSSSGGSGSSGGGADSSGKAAGGPSGIGTAPDAA
ncbi:hypothetical protein ABZ897_24060 [Nonomuraea sp. NPDC046802]|uniref:hypothetical protein n=1 Tax=Nonomuraea sp. NPDC046802 TaxID=3154919 RepID=UPI0033C09DF0